MTTPAYSNHLIIGLGGTGGKVIKAFRKAVYEEFRNVEPINADGSPHPIHVKYLYIDASASDLSASESWRTQGDIGPLVGIDVRSQLSLAHGDLQTRLRDPVHFPVTHRYIGDPKLWTDIYAQMDVQETAGGQMRRLGAALFEPKCSEFLAKVKDSVNFLEDPKTGGGVSSVAFHVVAGLAGGTGGGTFLHVIAQLRATYKLIPRNYPIFLYLLLPDEGSNWASNGDKTNYYANAYAALQDLNAYLVEDAHIGETSGGPAFTPFDLTNSTIQFEGQKSTMLTDRVAACFVLSNVNERNRVIGVKDEEIHNLIAQMMFQRNFFIDRFVDNESYRPLREPITGENRTRPDEADDPDSKQKERSTCFMTFGLKRIVVPEEEIREHFAASFASQAALQMLYNHWPADTATAFVDEKKKTSFKLDVQKQEKLDAWKLGDAHITLTKGVLAAEINNPRFRPIDQDWQEITPHLKDDAWSGIQQGGRDPRLDDLEKAFQQRYDETFRSIGVEKFYETAGRDLVLPDRHVAEICDTLEHWMFEQWLEGTYSITELEVFLEDLLEELDRRMSAIPGKLENFKKSLGKLSDRLDENRKLWSKVGPLGRLLGRPSNIFDAQATILTEQFEKRTLYQAWTFAEKLLKKVVTELRGPRRDAVAEFRVGLSEINDFFRHRLDQTCQDSSQNNLDATNVVKLYDPAHIRSFCRSLLEQEQLQRSWASELRGKAVDRAKEKKQSSMGGREKYFAMMIHFFIKTPDAKAVFEEISRKNALQAHEDATGRTNRHVGVNIVTKLSENYTDPEKLKNFVNSIVRSAQSFMQWKDVEFDGGGGPTAVLGVVLPICKEQDAFRDKLITEFRGAYSSKFAIIDSGHRPNEISLIACHYGFPLRYLQPIWNLKERYEKRLRAGSKERALLEVHIDDQYADLPDLFRAGPYEIGNRIIPWLQLAAALGLFERTHNEGTGLDERILRLKLEDNKSDKTESYSDALISLWELPTQPVSEIAKIERLINGFTPKQLAFARNRVQIELKKEKFKSASARDELQKTMYNQLQAVKQNRNNNEQDPIYKKMSASHDTAIEQVNNISHK